MSTHVWPQKVPVFFFLPDLNGGGAERAALNIVKSWREFPSSSDYEPVLVLRRMAGAYVDDVPEGIRILTLGSKARSGWFTSILTVRRLSQLIKQEKPALIVTFLSHPSAVLANVLAGTGAAIVASIQNPVSIAARDLHSSVGRQWIGKLKVWGTQLSYLRTSGFLVISHGIGRELTHDFHVEPSRVWLLPNSVELPSNRALPVVPSDLSRIKQGGKRVLIGTGRLVWQKGFDILLKSFANLAVKHPDWALVVLGEGPERDSLSDLARTLGISERVHFLGFQKSPAHYFSHSDIFVLSSRYEGFGNVIIEAMACGLPVVATNAPYGPADIIDNNKYGKLCAADSIEALTNALDPLMSDESARLQLRMVSLQRCRDYERLAVFSQLWSILSNRFLASSEGMPPLRES
ncbi:MAG: glycosyltransferase [Chitinophagaceae bacterium]|nr:MAG: glycosyltransferase [Chitinophagaceae bacterium]